MATKKLNEVYNAGLINNTHKFRCYIVKLCKEHNYPLHVTGNMDKTPLIFDMSPNRTDQHYTAEKKCHDGKWEESRHCFVGVLVMDQN